MVTNKKGGEEEGEREKYLYKNLYEPNFEM